MYAISAIRMEINFLDGNEKLGKAWILFKQFRGHILFSTFRNIKQTERSTARFLKKTIKSKAHVEKR